MDFDADKYLTEKSQTIADRFHLLDQYGSGTPVDPIKNPIVDSEKAAAGITSNPYMQKAISTVIDNIPMVASMAAGSMGGVKAEIKGVKPPVEGVVDASEAFANRGKTPMSPDTKLAKMRGEEPIVGATPALKQMTNPRSIDYGKWTIHRSGDSGGYSAMPEVFRVQDPSGLLHSSEFSSAEKAMKYIGSFEKFADKTGAAKWNDPNDPKGGK